MVDIIEYTPPAILDDMDVDTIHARMLADLPDNIDQTEGGFAWDMTRPSAIEKSYTMEALNTVVQIMFPEWATGYFLDLHARRCGVARKAAIPAMGYVRVIGTANVLIAKNFVFCTPATPISSSIEFLVTEAVTLEYDEANEDYRATVPVVCAEPGIVGNVPKDSIVLMSVPLSGITEVTNPEAMGAGAEEETDNELRERVMEIDRTRESSFIGNDNDYKRWAKQVEGVGGAAVIREWMGAGTGTVKVLVMDAEGQPASQALLNKVYTHIMGTVDTPEERLAPIGAIVTVATAQPLELNISAEVELDEGYELDTVKTSFRAALLAYFDQAKEEGVLRYTGVGNALHDTPGVLDYFSLTVNSGTANITVGIEDFPTIDTLTLTEAG